MDPQFSADRLAISDLLTRYAHAVDTRDWDLYRSVFTPDATIDYTSAPGGQAGDVETIVAWLEASLALFDMTQHLVSNEQVEITGDSATVRAMFHNPMRFTDGGGFFTAGGWYNHQLVRTADGWKSRHLVEETAYVHGL